MTKPGDFFVGIIDLFAIFLPGGAISSALYYSYYDDVLFNVDLSFSSSQYWVMFLFSSYLLGHIVFMFGSSLDSIYDMHRRYRNPYTNESAFQCASKIKKIFLSDNEAASVNTFQWAVSILTVNYPDAIAEINRLAADSKFFRSLVVIIPLFSLMLWFENMHQLSLIMLLFIIPCYLRYYDRRLKSTTRAYQYIVTFHGLGMLKP